MDPLSAVLRTVKLTGALFFLVDATSPWGIEVPHASTFRSIILPRSQHIISYHIILNGSGWASVPGEAPLRLSAGDIVVIPHADPYTMLCQLGQIPEFDTEATLRFFRDMAAGRLPFVFREGGGGPDGARFVCGFLGCDARPFNPLLTALPRLLHMKRQSDHPDDLLDRLIDLTLTETHAARVGSECVRVGLSELIFIELVRRYLLTLDPNKAGWLSGLRDPVVHRALGLMHEHPAYAWTIDALARQAGASRSILADRFTRLVGDPPMQYLARWRMQLAAGMLSEGTEKVATIAQAVGYSSEAAFSRTFKRIAGSAPMVWRGQRGTSGAETAVGFIRDRCSSS